MYKEQFSKCQKKALKYGSKSIPDFCQPQQRLTQSAAKSVGDKHYEAFDF